MDSQAREYFFHVVTVYSLKERSREVHVVFPKLGSGKSQTCHHTPEMGGLKQRDGLKKKKGQMGLREREKLERVNGSRTIVT